MWNIYVFAWHTKVYKEHCGCQDSRKFDFYGVRPYQNRKIHLKPCMGWTKSRMPPPARPTAEEEPPPQFVAFIFLEISEGWTSQKDRWRENDIQKRGWLPSDSLAVWNEVSTTTTDMGFAKNVGDEIWEPWWLSGLSQMLCQHSFIPQCSKKYIIFSTSMQCMAMILHNLALFTCAHNHGPSSFCRWELSCWSLGAYLGCWKDDIDLVALDERLVAV